MAFGLFVSLLLATGVMRLAELVVSVQRMRHRPDAVVSEPWLFPLMALLHTGLVVAPLAEVILLQRPLYVPGFVFSLGLLVLATALRVWTLSSVGPAWNVRVVRPQDDAISTRGPYAFIRHPNYLVVMIEVFALPLVHSALWSCAALSLLNGFVLFHRIRTEEQTLFTLPAWRENFSNKARFIPGVF